MSKKELLFHICWIVPLLYGLYTVTGKQKPKELTYDQKETIALKWLAEHEDRWRYTLCNVQLKPVKAEPMDSNGGGK